MRNAMRLLGILYIATAAAATAAAAHTDTNPPMQASNGPAVLKLLEDGPPAVGPPAQRTKNGRTIPTHTTNKEALIGRYH